MILTRNQTNRRGNTLPLSSSIKPSIPSVELFFVQPHWQERPHRYVHFAFRALAVLPRPQERTKRERLPVESLRPNHRMSRALLGIRFHANFNRQHWGRVAFASVSLAQLAQCFAFLPDPARARWLFGRVRGQPERVLRSRRSG